MSENLGVLKPGSIAEFKFGSYTGSTGASSALSNFAVGDILVYKDGSTTERASTSGYTATTSFDGVTGSNYVAIDLADNTTAGFWAAGSRYRVTISPVTIDSQTVVIELGSFRIGLPGAVLDTTIATLSSQTSFTLTLGPAEDDALNGCVVYIHDVASAVQGGFAVVNDYTGSTKTVTLTAGTTFTAAATDNISIFPPANTRWINTAAAATPGATGGILIAGSNAATTFAGLTTGALACTTITASGAVAFQSTFAVTTSTSLAALSCTTLTASGAVAFQSTFAVTTSTALGAISGSTLTLSGAVAFQSTFVVTGATTFTGAITGTNGSNDLRVNAVQFSGSATAADNAEIVFATDFATNYSTTTDKWQVEANVLAMAANTLTASALATDAVAEIADGVWDEAISGHLAGGSTGAALNAAGSAGDPWTTPLPGAYSVGTAGFIIGTNLDGTITSRMATYTQPTGFLAATFPNGTIANTTNITAGTIATATNVTTVNGLAANVITAAATAADFGTEIGTAVWANGTRSLTTLSGLTVDTVTTLTNLPAITANWLTAAGTAADFGTEVGTAVWASTTRLLTAGTNIVLAKGTGVTGFNDLSAAQVNAEADTALVDVGLTTTITGRIDVALSTLATAANLATVAGYLDTEIAAIKAKTDQLTTFDFVTAGTRLLTAIEADGAAGYQFTTLALENAPAGGGGSGLTAQQTRDAMKLAPSVGAAASGSIDDKLDNLAASSGVGAFIVTVTVTDGTDPLQNANVRLIEGVTPYTATTNASGVATFALDAATYSIAITKAGYQFTPGTIVVTAAGNFAKVMTEVVVAPPADPTLCRVYAYLQTKSGVPVVGATMKAKLNTPAKADAMITHAEITSAASDADGLVYLDLIVPTEITPAALEYEITIAAANFTKVPVTPTGATYNLGVLIT